MRPLGPLFDEELSDDEARILFRARKAEGAVDETMFMAEREIVIQLRRQNGNFTQLTTSMTNHLDKHPANEVIQAHLDDAHDAAVTSRFIRKAGGLGTVVLGMLISLWGVCITTLVFLMG